MAVSIDFPRRRLLAIGAGSALAAVAGGFAGSLARADEQPASLKDAARRNGIRYGSDADLTIEHAPMPFRALFAEQCDLYAANLSWKNAAPTPDANDPVREDPNLPFAYANDMAITGGHLVWHEGVPAWATQLTEASRLEAAIQHHIEAMARRYAGKVYSWNVVNEGLDPGEGRPDGLRNTAFLKVLGPQYMDFAFRAARQANVAPLLVYNDYNMEMTKPLHEMRRRALLRLLESFRRDGTPIDAVGLQSHLRLDGATFDESIYRTFLGEIAAMGFKIMITELDVLDLDTPSDIAARDKAVGELYRRFLAVALDQTAVIAVVSWGLSDRYTWLTAQRSASYARADGMPARPLPFDDWYQPKPAYHALLDAFTAAPPRKAV
jgi:endo-1,4-beta-xylanase